MRHIEAPRRNFKGATVNRSLPLSFLAGILIVAPMATVAAFPISGHSGQPTPSADVMQRWRGYALSRITPEFDWASKNTSARAAPTVLDRVQGQGARLVMPLSGDSRLALTLSLQPRFAGAAEHLSGDDSSPRAPLLGSLSTPFAGSSASTGLSRKFGRNGQADLSVVLAHQRFAAAMLDGDDYSASRVHPGLSSLSGSSYGTGMELDLHNSLVGKLDWYAGYRSRINMDSFQNFRGIYGNPGDLDIPARMQLGLAWQAARQTRFNFGVERIRYSSIQPFVSSALPRRVLAVLGDGTSPEFSWRDLNIYSVTAGHQFSPRNELSVRYSTGEQPQPTSPLLSSLLMKDAANYSLGLSFVHQTPGMRWRLMANYAPSEFVLGIPTSARRNQPDHVRQLEFESTWAWHF